MPTILAHSTILPIITRIVAVLVRKIPRFQTPLGSLLLLTNHFPVDVTLSSSARRVHEKYDFEVGYVYGGGVSGDFISDDFTIGGSTVSNFTIGLANLQEGTGGAAQGILGLGYNREAPIVDVLQTQGLIPTRAFSLYLGDRGIHWVLQL